MPRPLLSAGFLFAGLGLVLAGCAERPAEEPSPTPVAGNPELAVRAVNYPLAYFAGRIGGERVRVEFPAPPDEDPAFWSPGPGEVAAFQAADLILLNGAGYARWTEMAPLPTSRLVDTSTAFRDRYVQATGTVTHSHGPAGEHSHGDVAFTTWLDPTLAVEQARAVLDSLVEVRPEDEAAFRRGFESLEGDLKALDEDLSRITQGRSEVPLLASHPVYQYLARRYDLHLKSVHFEPDEFPDEESWVDLERLLARHPAKWMLWEGEPMAETKAKLQKLGVESVVFDPCGNRPGEGDFLAVMRSNVRNLEAVFPGP